MWPWEHLAVGYLAYSGGVRLWTGRRPRDPVAVVVLAIATQLPDLVDKPLAWSLGVLPTGTSLGHSVVVAVPLSLVVASIAWRAGRPGVGVAFAVGYLLHLPSDALYASIVLGSAVDPGSFAWPLVPASPMDRVGFGANVFHYFQRYAAVLTSPGGVSYLVAEVVLLGGAIALWLRDGSPGLELVVPGRWREPELHP